MVKGGPVIITTLTAPRGRRQLPQTPLTPRPAVSYKSTTPTSTTTSTFTTTITGGQQHRTGGHDDPPPTLPVTSIGLDPRGSHPPPAASSWDPPTQRGLPEDPDDFQDAVSSHGGRGGGAEGRSARTGTPSSAAAATTSHSGAGVPNGFHFTLGVNGAGTSGSGPRGAGGLRETKEEDWC